MVLNNDEKPWMIYVYIIYIHVYSIYIYTYYNMCIYKRQYSIVYGLSWSSIPCHANPKITGIDDHSEFLPKLDSALRWRVRLLSSQDTDLSMGESSMLFFEPINQPANMSNLSSGFSALLNFSHISPKEDVEKKNGGEAIWGWKMSHLCPAWCIHPEDPIFHPQLLTILQTNR